MSGFHGIICWLVFMSVISQGVFISMKFRFFLLVLLIIYVLVNLFIEKAYRFERLFYGILSFVMLFFLLDKRKQWLS